MTNSKQSAAHASLGETTVWGERPVLFTPVSDGVPDCLSNYASQLSECPRTRPSLRCVASGWHYSPRIDWKIGENELGHGITHELENVRCMDTMARSASRLRASDNCPSLKRRGTRQLSAAGPRYVPAAFPDMHSYAVQPPLSGSLLQFPVASNKREAGSLWL